MLSWEKCYKTFFCADLFFKYHPKNLNIDTLANFKTGTNDLKRLAM